MARRRHHQLLAVLLAAAAAVVAAAGAQEVPYAPISNTGGCSSWNNFSVGSGYQVNLFKLLGNLAAGGAAAGSGGFYSGSYGALSDMVFGVAMCYVDRHWTKCRRCLDAATSGAAAFCPYSRRVDVMYDECVLRYSDEINLFSFADSSGWYERLRRRHGEHERDAVGGVHRARGGGDGGVAAKKQEYTDSRGESLTVYGMVQCGRGLLPEECSKCLRHQLGELTTGLPNNTAGIIRGYSCYSRYDMASFPIQITSQSSPQEADGASAGSQWRLYIRRQVLAGVAAGSAAIFLCLSLSVCYILHRRRRDSKIRPVKLPSSSRDESVEPDLEHGGGPRRFSYGELAAATNDFSDDRKLGEGGFGSVYRGFLEGLNLHVAVKRISRSSQQGWKEFVSEVKIISRLRHRNLVLLIGWCHEPAASAAGGDGDGDGGGDKLLLVYELMCNGSVESHLYNRDTLLPWPARYEIVLGIGSALLYLHQETEQRVVHRDIKPSNVMLDASFNAKLGDFGLARLIGDRRTPSQTTATPTTRLAGTMGYMDPECMVTGRASVESDVYSFGVALLELACGRCPVMTRPDGSAVHLAQRVRELHDAGRVTAAADGRLNGGFDGDEMERVLVVRLWCAHPDRGMRPAIRQAVNVLRFDAPLPSLPPPAKMPPPPGAPSHSRLPLLAADLFPSLTRPPPAGATHAAARPAAPVNANSTHIEDGRAPSASHLEDGNSINRSVCTRRDAFKAVVINVCRHAPAATGKPMPRHVDGNMAKRKLPAAPAAMGTAASSCLVAGARRLHRVEARHRVAVHHGHAQEHRERQRAEPVPVVPRRRRAGAVDEAEAAAGRDEVVAHGARAVAVAVGEGEQEAAECIGADEAGDERTVGGRVAVVRGGGRREHLEGEHGAGREVLCEALGYKPNLVHPPRLANLSNGGALVMQTGASGRYSLLRL
uniref:Protein kinase domain containing protein n=1 Tax=Oryza sativa subsp. japonica TaxID=39947 RepID=Q2QMG0_ORYSJ|nr:Protein kinase domain containing protein [Oryza sativa Japonica Group]